MLKRLFPGSHRRHSKEAFKGSRPSRYALSSPFAVLLPWYSCTVQYLLLHLPSDSAWRFCPFLFAIIAHVGRTVHIRRREVAAHCGANACYCGEKCSGLGLAKDGKGAQGLLAAKMYGTSWQLRQSFLCLPACLLHFLTHRKFAQIAPASYCHQSFCPGLQFLAHHSPMWLATAVGCLPRKVVGAEREREKVFLLQFQLAPLNSTPDPHLIISHRHSSFTFPPLREQQSHSVGLEHHPGVLVSLSIS